MSAATMERATVWRVGGGRRYLSRRAAVEAYARRRMREGHAPGDESDGYAPCVDCLWCADASGTLRRRYVRFLMRRTKPVRIETFTLSVCAITGDPGCMDCIEGQCSGSRGNVRGEFHRCTRCGGDDVWGEMYHGAWCPLAASEPTEARHAE